MKKSIIITAFLAMSSLAAIAQEKTSAKPDSIIKIVPVQAGAKHGYSINGNIQTPESVKARLYAYAPSKVELLKSSNESSWLGISIIGFGVSTIGATLEFIDKNGSENSTNNQHSLTAAYVLTGTATAFIFAAIFHATRAHKHAHKALVVYNQQYQ